MKAPDERKVRAARALAQGSTLPDAAVAAGVDRATVVRWKRDPAFQALQAAEESRPPDTVADTAIRGLEALVPKALSLLEEALLPGSAVTGQMAKNALDVIKAASALRREDGAAGGGSLEALLTEIDGSGEQAFVSD
jgi:hypothetical protein